MQNALVLRGEEKRFAGQINDAAYELQTKLGGWSALFYGSLQFLLGYATGGPNIKYGGKSDPQGLIICKKAILSHYYLSDFFRENYSSPLELLYLELLYRTGTSTALYRNRQE